MTAYNDPAFEELTRQIRSYRDLHDDWDTYGGLPAKEHVVSFAVGLLEELCMRLDTPLPHVAPISTGVYNDWSVGDRILYVEADEDSIMCQTSGFSSRLSEVLLYLDPCFDVSRAVRAVRAWVESVR